MANALQSVATRAAIDSPQTGHRALFALLSTLQSFVQSAATTSEVETAIERTRTSAARQASSDTYRLVIAVGSNIPRVEIVSRGNADPPAYVDAVSANGTLFTIQRIGAQWFLLNAAGQPGKLTAPAFLRALADGMAPFLRAA